MLEPNSIPSLEPLIRVGIILPEDSKEIIHIQVPQGRNYSITSDNTKNQKLTDNSLTFKKVGSLVELADIGLSSTWKLSPIKKEIIAPKSGIILRDAVAGRGFHWQKFIDVFLSGSVEFSMYQDQLILINELPIEEYLMCVATSEMSAECPDALIEAQTIAARSWMLANVEQKHIKLGMDVCNDDCCQRYQGTTHLSHQSIAGAMRTYGQVLLFENKICDARYSKSCGGVMETFSTVWQGNDLPYLQNKVDFLDINNTYKLPLNTNNKISEWVNTQPDSFCCPKIIPEESLPKYLGNVDKEGKYYRWQFQYTQEEILALLNKQLKLDAIAILSLEPLSRGGSGRIINLKIKYLDKNNAAKSIIVERDVEIRRVLHENFMYSSCIYVETKNNTVIPARFKQGSPSSGAINDIPQDFIIKGAGWGHGVGLCQIGALGMSLKGYETEEILYHYFPDSRLEKIY